MGKTRLGPFFIFLDGTVPLLLTFNYGWDSLPDWGTPLAGPEEEKQA
jgi:hypothetical protein